MTKTKTIENRKYKSDVFSMLMEEPKYALDVYNALNDSDYDDPNIIEIKNLDKCVSLSIRNDAAFIIGMNLNIYEHQSTYNPNMPLRSLIYLADILKPLIKDAAIYSSSKIKIPTPNFVVFYNGTEDRPQKEIQKLSDLYDHDDNINLELVCTVYNINPGFNKDISKRSYVLRGYTIFVEKVRENLINNISEAVSNAVEYCISHDILADFFARRKDEVIRNMTIDMTFERRMELEIEAAKQVAAEEGRAEGHAEGLAEGRNETMLAVIKSTMKNTQKSFEDVCEMIGINESEISYFKERL